MPLQDIERRTQEIGASIYSSAMREVPSIFDRRRWKGKVMEWAMRDETFKTQLFRFIDVLPVLKTDRLVVRLLKEYLSQDAPGIMRWLIRLGGLIPGIAGRMVRLNVEGLAGQFIAGRDTQEALPVFKGMRDEGVAFILSLLGEVVVSEREAKGYTRRYLEVLGHFHSEVMVWRDVPILDRDEKGPIPRLHISLKVSSFYSQLDPMDWEGSINSIKANLRPIFRKARELGVSVTLDMEHYYYKDITIAIFKSLLEEGEFKDYPFAGIALQTYLRDTKKDLLDIIDWARRNKRVITIRLVKGAYWDYEVVVNRQKGWPIPVFLDKAETDLNYEGLTRLILENTRFIRPAIATHNIRGIAHAMALAEALGLPKETLEFQMLYGMAEPIRTALKGMGYRLRVYTPVGGLIPGMGYLVRRLLENTSNESFLRRSFIEEIPLEGLMKAPEPSRAKTPKPPPGDAFRNEPPTDFSKADNRKRMRDALYTVRKGFGRRYPLYIGKREVWKEREIISLNPANPQETIGKVSSATMEDVERAIVSARKTWEAWRKTTPDVRADYLFMAAEGMRKKRFELSSLEVYEVGKGWKEADADVVEAIDHLEYYGREMLRLSTPRSLGDYPGEVNEYLYEPRGIGVAISPWNFPLAIPVGLVSAGIVTGNCVILKPSSLSPVTGWRLIEIFRDVGLPPGVLQFLPGPGKEVGEYLVSHPGIDFIAFTGSKDVGLRIVELAGKTHPGQRNVKRVIGEFGGKNAIIVDETADVDEAVKGVLESSLGYQGQKCSACSRVIVVGEVFDEFCERLKGAMEGIRIGEPKEPGSFMGPVVDEGALKKIKGYIDMGKGVGKVILLREVKGDGYFIGPVIFGDIDPNSPLAQEEIFGPVVVVMRARDIDEAIEIANNSIYALTGGVFSRSPSNIRKVREGMRVGNLYINRRITGALVGRQPFGGFGMSGVGSKAGGPDYLLQFMHPRSISENTLRRGLAPRGQGELGGIDR